MKSQSDKTPTSITLTMTLKVTSLEGLDEAARLFLEHYANRSIIAFYGSMGAGKTTFIKALCWQLGVADTVTSPTFAIVNEYESTGGPVYHFDFYRIKRIEEVYDMGYEDYFYSGHLCLIEWPELIEDLLPADTLRVTIAQQADGSREISPHA